MPATPRTKPSPARFVISSAGPGPGSRSPHRQKPATYGTDQHGRNNLPHSPAPSDGEWPRSAPRRTSERYAFNALGGIPALWQRLAPHFGHIPGQISTITYGACYDTNETGFEYLAGVEVRDVASLPRDFVSLRVAKQHYAVFTHPGHVSTIRGTLAAIFNGWLPQSGSTRRRSVFERYDERFDQRTGNGGFEIWIPVKI